MKKTFTEPIKPEELYMFFTYGLALTPLDWRSHWWPENIINHIRRRLWCIRVVSHTSSVMVEYHAGNKESDKSWYMYERKYLCQTKNT